VHIITWRVVLKFSVVVEKDEDCYYVAFVPDLPGCRTPAKTLDELMERAGEVGVLWSEVEFLTEVERSSSAYDS